MFIVVGRAVVCWGDVVVGVWSFISVRVVNLSWCICDLFVIV